MEVIDLIKKDRERLSKLVSENDVEATQLLKEVDGLIKKVSDLQSENEALRERVEFYQQAKLH